MKENFADLKQDNLDSAERQKYVTQLFDDLAPCYDRFNRLVSLFGDERWRRITVTKLQQCAMGVVLDLAAGTGDLANSARKTGAQQVHVFDISHEMLFLARNKLSSANGKSQVAYAQGSAHILPYRSQSIDGVVSGFAMRNIFHFLDAVLLEMYRVLKPGGRFAILELSQPANPLIKFGFRLHLKTIMPLIGRFATGRAAPFDYLRQTTMTFLAPEAFRQRLQHAGFSEVAWQSFLFGGIAIHYGMKK